MPTMIIIRGVPGSGKSTVASAMAAWFDNSVVCEADDFFYDDDNNYKYDAGQIQEAHQWCYYKAVRGCMEGKTVIVSNTAALEKQVKEYVDIAQEYGYNIQIITCQSTFENVHALPDEAMDKFNKRMIYKRFDIK